MSDEVLKPCPICSKKAYIGLYGDGRDYWWMVHGGMHYDECKCRLFMESCKFELEDEAKVDCDEYATGIRDGLVRRWNTRAELGSGTCELVETDRYSNSRETIHVLECSECGKTCEHVNGSYPRCPHCGAKVVSA